MRRVDDPRVRVCDLYSVPPHVLGIGRPHRFTWRARRRARLVARRLGWLS